MESNYIGVQRTSSRKRMIAAISLIAVVAVIGTFAFFGQSSSTSAREDFDHHVGRIYKNWKKEHGIIYGGAEDQERFEIFNENYAYIHHHNMKPNNSYHLGLNQFAALTVDEFSALYLGFRPDLNTEEYREDQRDMDEIELFQADLEPVDWTAKGRVTAVKNQLNCGSCWAFSATGAIEAAIAIKENKAPISLSEQELVDCSAKYGNQGCNGGLMTSAFKYVIEHNLNSATDYAYKARDLKCTPKMTATRAKIAKYMDVKASSKESLQQALTMQPVSVAVQADSRAFQLYKSGVVTGAACGTSLNHGVLAVGFGVLNKVPFYLVKNSWGETWGDNGYIRIGVEDGAGVCGIHMMSSYPIA